MHTLVKSWWTLTLTALTVVGIISITISKPVIASEPGCSPGYYTPTLVGTGATAAAAVQDLKTRVDFFIAMDCPDGECGGHWVQITTPAYWDGSQYRAAGRSLYRCAVPWGGEPMDPGYPSLPCEWFEVPPSNCH